GIAAALVIWGPRLAAGCGKEEAPPPRAAAGTGGAAAAGALGKGAETRRDPASIRAEFIRISGEARSLRDVALPVALPAVPRDPFAARESALAAAAPAEPSPEEGGAVAERERAAALRLEGVFHFRNGSSAVVDGVVLRKGEEHQGFTVVAIEGRTVTLRGAYAEHRVTMEDEKER
ncbi:MAG: hypothetical protein HY812_15750, partial [Planctomycetes bacterium]|nr:hypothetical protein [Planctomycetota bacterium]